jgi:hypothetical protein
MGNILGDWPSHCMRQRNTAKKGGVNELGKILIFHVEHENNIDCFSFALTAVFCMPCETDLPLQKWL